MLCCQIFRQVGDGVTGYLHGGCTPRGSHCGGGIDSGGVIYKIGGEGWVLHLLIL